jgi:hypothetical protein
MARALVWAVPISCVAYLVLQVVALKQLTGKRLANAQGGLVVAVLAAFCLFDWARTRDRLGFGRGVFDDCLGSDHRCLSAGSVDSGVAGFAVDLKCSRRE